MYNELMQFRRSGKQTGFSLVEAMVVVAILLCISAYAVPNFMMAIANLRLRGGMSSLSSLLQNCRMMSIKANQTYSVHFTTMSAGPVAYVKVAGDTAGILSTDVQAQLGAPVTMDQNPTGTGAPTQLDMSILNFTPLTSDPSFNARGIPCIYSSGTCTAPKGYVFYFRGKRPFGSDGWAAVSISPAGHVKSWYWNGSSWGN
jgi:prepilin-type N-terminal cleavage/methylation domain-containing protein